MNHATHPQQVVIAGGGVMGSAMAYFLASHPRFAGEVTVIERDPSYAQASPALSASSIRQQFSQPVNIAVSQFGIQFLRNIKKHLALDGDVPDIGLTERGYLYLASEAGAATLQENHATQRALGVEVALLAPDELRLRFPWLNVDDLALGVEPVYGLNGAALGCNRDEWADRERCMG